VTPDFCEIDIDRDDRDFKRYRVNCRCGFLGPWRRTKRTALNDGDDHMHRRAEGLA
jgi:hypothetical protein